MKSNETTEDLQIYGAMFAVTNLIQSEGDFVIDGITMRQQFLLILLSQFGDESPTLQELAEVFGSSYQNVKRMASQLEEDNYLVIKKDSVDRRKIRLILNQRNFDKLQKSSVNRMKEFMNQIFSGVSSEDKSTLLDTLRIMEDNLKQVKSKSFS